MTHGSVAGDVLERNPLQGVQKVCTVHSVIGIPNQGENVSVVDVTWFPLVCWFGACI